MEIDAFLERLEAVRPAGKGWVARCPAHDDRHPSLSIHVGSDSRILVRCHAGCSFDQVLAALGLESPALRPAGAVRPMPALPDHKPKKSYATPAQAADVALRMVRGRQPAFTWSLATKYDYRTAAGELRMQVLRFEAAQGRKTFVPIHHDLRGWSIGDPPGQLPLYHLDEIGAAGRIFVCEGEKAAECARQLRLVATTSAHGASAAARTDWTPLAGKDVIVLPDNDEPGRRYARAVALALTKNDPLSTVRILQLPGLPPGGDIVEFATVRTAAGRTQVELVQELEQLVSREPRLELVRGELQPAYVPFPIHVLPELFVRFVGVSSKAIGCDPAYVALPLLAVCSSAIGHSREIQVKQGWREPAVLWTIIVGDSGTLKSPAIDLALQPLRKLQKEAFERYEALCAKFEQESLDYARTYRKFVAGKGGDKRPSRPRRPKAARLLVSDTTTEAIAEVLAANAFGVLLYRDELSGWFSSFDRYTQRKGADVSFWLEAYGARPVLIDRKTGKSRTIYVSRAAVSITGGIQPAVLARSLGQANIENGLAARFLMAMPPRRRKEWTETEVGKPVLDILLDTVQFLHRLSPEQTPGGDPVPKTLRFSARGRQAWVEFFTEHAAAQEASTCHDAAALAKLEGACARLALVIHEIRVVTQDPSLESGEDVDEQSVRAAAELVRWFRQENRRIYALLAPEAQEADQKQKLQLLEQLGGGASIRAWQRARSLRNAPQAERELQELAEEGLGYWEEVRKDGRGRPAGKVLRLRSASKLVAESDADTNDRNDEKACEARGAEPARHGGSESEGTTLPETDGPRQAETQP